MMEVGKTAIDERPDKIEGERGAVARAEVPDWDAFRLKIGPIHHIPGKRAGLCPARLGVDERGLAYWPATGPPG